MERLYFYVDPDLAASIRLDAKTKGQTLSTWLSRAAQAVLDAQAKEAFATIVKARTLKQIAAAKRHARLVAEG